MGQLLLIVLTLVGIYFCLPRSTEKVQTTELTRAIKDDVNLAYKTYVDGGITGLISLSKERHVSIGPNVKSLKTILGTIAIDMVGQSLSEGVANELGFEQDDYFNEISVSIRISDLSEHLQTTNYSNPDSIRKFIQPLINKIGSEKFGPSNYVIGEKIKIFVPIALNILKTSGLNELKGYSQSSYQKFHKNSSISLSMLEKCAAIDMTGGMYLSDTSISNSDKYFSPKFTIARIGPYFAALGLSMEEANLYLRSWEARVRKELKQQ